MQKNPKRLFEDMEYTGLLKKKNRMEILGTK